jgi:hypothetical protein
MSTSSNDRHAQYTQRRIDTARENSTDHEKKNA